MQIELKNSTYIDNINCLFVFFICVISSKWKNMHPTLATFPAINMCCLVSATKNPLG